MTARGSTWWMTSRGSPRARRSCGRASATGGWLYHIASPDNATQRYLYRSRLDGKGNAARVSPAASAGTHFYNISPDAHCAFHTYSNFNNPSVIELVQLPTHRVVRTLVDNSRQ